MAEILKKYLPSIINQVNPWLSSQQIDAGARWSAEIAKNLEASNVGICCVTAENQNSPWILFEAGAIAKLTSIGRAIVLRIDLKATDITGPLSQFQSVSLEQEDIWKLVVTINKAEPSPVPDNTLRITFDALWPKIQADLGDAVSSSVTQTGPERSSEDVLDEVLALARRQDSAFQNLSTYIAEINARLGEMTRLSQVGLGGLYTTISTPGILASALREQMGWTPNPTTSFNN